MRNRILLIIGIILFIFLLIFLTMRLHGKPAVLTAQGSLTVSGLFVELQDAQSRGDLSAQKSAYQKLINNFSNNKDINSWQKKSDDINIKILFSPMLASKLDKEALHKNNSADEGLTSGMSIDAKEYVVQPLDNLNKIARQFNTTVEFIKKSNGLSSNRINPGDSLRIWAGKFSIFVDKSQNILVLKSNDEIVKTYTVSTGLNNSTPVGTFKVVNKLMNPVWYKESAVVPAGSPENILGTRWMGFDLKGYGIHGTTIPSSLGKQATAGCVRMLNSEVEELYTIVPVGTEVTVVD